MSTLDVNLDAPVLLPEAKKEEKEAANEAPQKWKNYQKIAFRIGFLYMLFLCSLFC